MSVLTAEQKTQLKEIQQERMTKCADKMEKHEQRQVIHGLRKPGWMKVLRKKRPRAAFFWSLEMNVLHPSCHIQLIVCRLYFVLSVTFWQNYETRIRTFSYARRPGGHNHRHYLIDGSRNVVGDRFCESVGFRSGFNVVEYRGLGRQSSWFATLQPADKENTPLVVVRLNPAYRISAGDVYLGSACFLILNGIKALKPHELNSPEIGIYVSLFAMVMTFRSGFDSKACRKQNR